MAKGCPDEVNRTVDRGVRSHNLEILLNTKLGHKAIYNNASSV